MNTTREQRDGILSGPFTVNKEYVRELCRDVNALEDLLCAIAKGASKSESGLSIDRIRHAENGRVLENGYRVCTYHNLGPVKPTLEEAVIASLGEVTL